MPQNGLSHAELARACEHAAKDVILDHRIQVGAEELTVAMSDERFKDNPGLARA